MNTAMTAHNAEASQYSILDAIAPQNFEQVLQFADIICKSGMVPKDYINNPGAVIVSLQMGAEIGLKPMQSLQNISNIGGRPSVWGDAALAIIKNHHDFEYIVEEWDETTKTATCKTKAKSESLEVVREFSMNDAQKAQLSNKTGPWRQYPRRMCQMRARSWALRDTFPHVLKGISIREEVEDKVRHEEKEIVQETRQTRPSDLSARLQAAKSNNVEAIKARKNRNPIESIEEKKSTIAPTIEGVVIEESEPEKIIDEPFEVESDKIQKNTNITEAVKGSKQDHSSNNENDKKPKSQYTPPSDEEQELLDDAIEKISQADCPKKLREIGKELMTLHPDLKEEARKLYVVKMKDLNRKR